MLGPMPSHESEQFNHRPVAICHVCSPSISSLYLMHAFFFILQRRSMAFQPPLSPPSNVEHGHYSPLPADATARPRQWRLLTIAAAVLFLVSLVGLVIRQGDGDNNAAPGNSLPPPTPPLERGVAEGVSAKSNYWMFPGGGVSFNWTNAMFAWQRTAFHFQPENNWMNDPNGPLYYNGWYHLFYQYNPFSAVWGNISWGHTVSRDLIHWYYLPLALVPGEWYDINGVWSGSATLLPDGQIVMLYTGDTVDSVQVIALAYPANLSDPLLLDWVKYPGNPVVTPPSWAETDEFRDPTTAWAGPNGTWRITVGTKINTTGMALVYQTTNFTDYELLDGVLHKVPGTGMWECVDFYPVSTTGSAGLDTSANGPGIKHVLKASLDDTKLDRYALGTYDPVLDKWTPDNPTLDVGIGLRYDYGRYYASKTFYDQNKGRRILWGWINETDTEDDDLEKGWSSLQTIPRTVVFDEKTGTNLLYWPVEEVESLRLNCSEFDIEASPGSVVPIDIGLATQLDILAEFEYDVVESGEEDENYTCSGGAVERSTTGPFGLLVLADAALTELTPVFFRVTNSSGGSPVTYFCADETRSSLATGVYDSVYGSTVPVLDGEKLQMRVLVDHSIVESFSQGGRMVISSRIYPTEAIYGAARLFLFNNATGATVRAKLKVWQMQPAYIRPYPFADDQ